MNKESVKTITEYEFDNVGRCIKEIVTSERWEEEIGKKIKAGYVTVTEKHE